VKFTGRRLVGFVVVLSACIAVSLGFATNAWASHCSPQAHLPNNVPGGIQGHGQLNCSGSAHSTSWTITLQQWTGTSWVITTSRTQSATLGTTTYIVFTNTVGCSHNTLYRSVLTSTTVSYSGSTTLC
jgi:hypothetical protein